MLFRSGWVTEKLGHIPEVGEEFEYENLHIVVTQIGQRHVDEVHITVREIEEETEE